MIKSINDKPFITTNKQTSRKLLCHLNVKPFQRTHSDSHSSVEEKQEPLWISPDDKVTLTKRMNDVTSQNFLIKTHIRHQFS